MPAVIGSVRLDVLDDGNIRIGCKGLQPDEVVYLIEKLKAFALAQPCKIRGDGMTTVAPATPEERKIVVGG